ncbi:MAG: trigger factor [Treponema sp.]|nr:trigger factor [Treponema sp.]
MTVTKEFKQLEHSALQLTLTINKDDIRSEYDELITKYGKTMQIPGFRKGKIPRDILTRKFGDAFKRETLEKVVEKAISTIFEDESFPKENRPLPYSTPQLKDEDLKLDIDTDLAFSIVYDIFPQITVGPWKGLEVETPDVEVAGEDLDRELQAIRERNAIVLDKSDDAAAAKGDVVTVNYAEISDAGEIIPGTERQDFVFTLGTGYNIFKFDDEILGMKKGETRDIDKSYPEDFEDKDLAGKTRKIRVTLNALKEKQLPELDDDLAQDVDEKFTTLEDLKNSIKERLTWNVEKKLRDIAISKLLEKIRESTPVDVPESMILVELENQWQNLARQFKTAPDVLAKNMEKTGGSKGSLFEGWRPEAVKVLQSRLIVETLINELGFEVSDEDIEKEFEAQSRGANIPADELKKYYESEQMGEYLKEQIKERKFFDLLLSENTIKKGNHTKYLDLVSNNG